MDAKVFGDLSYMVQLGYVVVSEKDTIDLMRFLDNLKWEQEEKFQESYRCLQVITPLLIADYNNNAKIISKRLDITCPKWGD